jgi:hypothetical protein
VVTAALRYPPRGLRVTPSLLGRRLPGAQTRGYGSDVQSEDDRSWLKDWRVWGLGAACLVIGFLIGLIIFGEPWHLPPAWGDIPTWLLAIGAGIGTGLALMQLRDLRQQIAKDAERNAKRDELMDKQIADAEAREISRRRRLAEEVEIFSGRSAARVINNSKRPVSDITCKVMSSIDRHTLRTAKKSGLTVPFPTAGGWALAPDAKDYDRVAILRPGSACGYIFEIDGMDPDMFAVAWFTDDEKRRWQLDEHGHLVESADETEYVELAVQRRTSIAERDDAAQ